MVGEAEVQQHFTLPIGVHLKYVNWLQVQTKMVNNYYHYDIKI